jgi:hypothetical protein
MLYVIFLPLAVTLAVYFIPVLLLQRKQYRQAQDFFVASTPTSPTVFQNASIAYQLQMATFGPFFLWGATGDFLPAIVNSLFFGIGLFAVYRFRGPLFDFLTSALGSDSSITLHEFIARQHGNSNAVRLAASTLTLIALFGLALGECLGLFALLKPFASENAETTYGVTLAILTLVFLYATLAGNSGVMRSDQTHLGIAYAGLFSVTAIILVNIQQAGNTLSSQSVLAVAVLGLISLVFLMYRRVSTLDPTVVGDTHHGSSLQLAEAGFLFFEKALNFVIAAAAFAVVLAADYCCAITSVKSQLGLKRRR